MEQDNNQDRETAIDAAINEVRGRKARGERGNAGNVSDEERQAQREQRKAERAVKQEARKREQELKRQERQALRAARKAEREAKKGSQPHLSKVERAASRLPQLADEALELFNCLDVENVDVVVLSTVIAHAQVALRRRQTIASKGIELKEGQLVTITGGEGKWIGHNAVVTSCRAIRTVVRPVGSDRDVYCYTADLAPVQVADGQEVSDAVAAS